MDIQLLILLIFVMGIVYAVKFLQKKKVTVTEDVPLRLKKTLEDLVPFYQELNESQQAEFEERAAHFLSTTKITGA